MTWEYTVNIHLYYGRFERLPYHLCLPYHKTRAATNMDNSGFSLIEVMVAITMLALVAGSVLALTNFHKSNAAAMTERLHLYTRTATLIQDLPYQLSADYPEFPHLNEDEKFREYEGKTPWGKWKARLERVEFGAMPLFYRFTLQVDTHSHSITMIRYLIPRNKNTPS